MLMSVADRLKLRLIHVNNLSSTHRALVINILNNCKVSKSVNNRVRVDYYLIYFINIENLWGVGKALQTLQN
ncbi:hypothetical protein XBJ1_2792 [Xenorhabdus bovienii SS-2004]|uniref:Uncharacterized protein n=1 Tax=Xenorhabdus bovienii (strain SS-2004) TaxID=406818 RepID=D3V7V4_XENBS|nr:hypothetical protein XBJ1_2792 [Xenorhabdus bovienii SS-2004]